MWVTAWADNKTEYDVIEKKVQQKKNWANKPQKKKQDRDIIFQLKLIYSMYSFLKILFSCHLQ